jgi:energy-coupling factor transport system ATP-binding protein
VRRTRWASLRGAVLLAVGFVLLRVVYRVVFGGAGGGGTLLLDPPRIRLSGPFEHVTLFGPITTGGIANAAASALPFAALVLAFGVISVVVDVRALLARGTVRGPVRTISRALVIAWATFPALLESVRRVRVARELRAARGPASLIVPVLEQTVERAIALGSSMEVRGFAATRRREPECERPARLRGVSLGYEGAVSIRDLDLDLTPGSLTLVTGPTGSGKSTVLHALSGVLQHVSGGEQAGVIEVAGVDRLDAPPRETAGFVGVVLQSVRLSFVAARVDDEVGFALVHRGVDSGLVSARVREVADRVGISHLLDREVVALSAGEACLVAIAAAIVESPVLLLVDEPLADLDFAARTRIVDLLDVLAHDAGVCVVVAEHSPVDWGDRADARLELGEALTAPIPPPATPELGPVVLEVSGVTVEHAGRVAVDGAALALASGELVALRGPNGAGKSSLLHVVALPSRSSTVIVDGRDVHSLGRRARRAAVALVPEAFDDLLIALTVAEEARGAIDLFARLLGRDVTPLLARHPRDLSAGERLCLVLAIQLAARPRVLLIDEPSRGLDARARALVAHALLEAASSGTAVMFATHDDHFATIATRVLPMAEGRLSAEIVQ